jgi:hypothetical protein
MSSFKITVTSSAITKSGQAVTFTELVNYGDYRLRLTIKSDSYDFQCYARLENFDKQTMQWSVVVHRPHGDMQTESKLVYSRFSDDLYIKKFDSDRLWLLKQFANLID